jgi:hypothetical protein
MAATLDRLPVEITPEERTYRGSRYSDVVAAIFANLYRRAWGAAGEPALPVHQVTFRSVASGMLAASEGAIDSRADLRWGADRLAFRVRRTFSDGRAIGELIFDNAVVSHNGDAVLHFSHPTWRTDRNDPQTATRVDGRKGP